MTCDECTSGIMSGVDQLLSDEIVAAIVDALSGDGFCGMEDDSEMCSAVIAALIPAALPALAGSMSPDELPAICNTAVPDTCPAY